MPITPGLCYYAIINVCRPLSTKRSRSLPKLN